MLFHLSLYPVMLSKLFFSFELHFTAQIPPVFRTPPVSPPRSSPLTRIRRVCSLDLSPHLMTYKDSGFADPILGSSEASEVSENSFPPQSIVYNWSCAHFSKPLLTAPDDNEDMMTTREKREKISLGHIARCQHSCGSFKLMSPLLT